MADRGSKWVLFGVFLVPGLLLAGGIYVAVRHFVTSASGHGKVQVLAPMSGPLDVSVDGNPAVKVAAGDAHAFDVVQGPHDVVLTDARGEATRHHVDVKDGFFDDMLPTSQQCFAVLDVTHWVYKSESTLPGEVVEMPILGRLTRHAPIHLVEDTYLRIEDAPEKISANHTIRLVMELPCSTVMGSDDEVAEAARRRLLSWRDIVDAE
jgi:hypothetical protein